MKYVHGNTFMIPFQLSPVATRNKVKNAMPKSLKCACSPRPSQGISSVHSIKIKNTRQISII